MENVELYILAILLVLIIGLVINTIYYYKNQKEKIRNLHKHANEGDADAQETLAKMYEVGELVQQDSEKSAYWHQKASFSRKKEMPNDTHPYSEHKKKKRDNSV